MTCRPPPQRLIVLFVRRTAFADERRVDTIVAVNNRSELPNEYFVDREAFETLMSIVETVELRKELKKERANFGPMRLPEVIEIINIDNSVPLFAIPLQQRYVLLEGTPEPEIPNIPSQKEWCTYGVRLLRRVVDKIEVSAST